MALVIKKRVTFEQLGDNYASAYLEFRAIPMDDLTGIDNRLPKDDNADTNEATKVFLDVLKKYFIAGKFPDEHDQLSDVTKDDLNSLDADSVIKSFQILTGTDPNLGNGSPTTSPQPTPTE